MEIQRKTMSMASEDRLSDLPDEILIHILSRVWYEKQVVRTSILSTRWRFLWTFVPVSLEFYYRYDRDEKNILDIIASVHAELYHRRCCKKIRTFRLCDIKYEKRYVEHFDIWVHFATKVANVEDFSLQIDYTSDTEIYEFPQFAYKNTWLKKVVLKNCQLNPFSGSVNWTSLVKLSVGDIELADGVMEKVLSGCPNLERLTLDDVWGFRRLEITSAKLRKLNIVRVNPRDGLDILAPYIQYLKVSNVGLGIHFNLASLVTAVLHLHYSDFQDDEDKMEEQCSYLKELLHSLAHVHNLELDHWCIECLSILELQGWQSPPSHWKFVKLNTALEELDFPGICSFLQSSSHLETLVINWSNCARIDLLSRYTNKDEQHRRFETHNFDYSLRHLKTIEIIIFRGPLSKNMFIGSLVKFFLKNATVLEKFIIAGEYRGSDVSQDYVKMEQEFLSFPRSSPHASVVFSYQ